ncbi:MAG TPA: hypothetical protein PKC30_12555 [Saprospiraceae bacterium]|nr:hypothetical protein [Saprospiraceae bacterium]
MPATLKKLVSGKLILEKLFYLIFFFILFIIIFPGQPDVPRIGLDAGWVNVISHAYFHNFQFGKDIHFTFGPAGIFHLPYFLYSREAMGNTIFLAFLLVFIICTSLYHLLEKQTFAFRIIISFSIVWGLLISTAFIWYLFPLILPGLYYHSFKRNILKKLLVTSIIFLLALSVLIKFSYFPTAFLVVLLLDVDNIMGRKRLIPQFLLVFLAFLILTFVLLKQNILHFPKYIYGSLQIMSGYSEAMQIWNPLKQLQQPIVFILLSMCLISSLFNSSMIKELRKTLILLIVLSASLYISFKNGFTRHDGHALIAFSGLCVTAGFIPIYFREIISQSLINRSLYLLTLYFTITGSGLFFMKIKQLDKARYTTITSMTTSWLNKYKSAKSFINYPSKLSQLDKAYDLAVEKVKDQLPIEFAPTDGTIDVYPNEQTYILAHGLNYKPRPIFQSYSAYTQYLLQQNKNHLIGNDAPDYILFGVFEIDGRLPALMDGHSWLEIMSRYEIVHFQDNHILFKKSPQSKKWELKNSAQGVIEINQPLPIPSGKLYAQLEMKKSLLGQMMNIFFKLPYVYITYKFENENTATFRMIPGMMNNGFFISPVIRGTNDFLELYLSNEVSMYPKEFTIHTQFPIFYKKNISYTFQMIIDNNIAEKNSFELILLSNVRQKKMTELRIQNILNDTLNISKTGNHLSFSQYKGEPIIFCHTGTSFTARYEHLQPYINDETQEFQLNFGIFDHAYSDGNQCQGACFRLYSIHDEKPGKLFFEKCIDPMNNPHDQGVLTEYIILPNDSTIQYLFEVMPRPGHHGNWGWAYWK